MNTYGAAVITISKMPQTFITIDEYLEFQKRKDVTYDDYRAVLSDCKSCVSVGAQRRGTGKVVRGTKSTTDTQIRGWTWTMPALSNLNIAIGALVHRSGGRRTARTWRSWAPTLWTTCWGRAIRWARRFAWTACPYTVIGVGEAQGKMFGQSMDNWVAIPLTAFLERYGSQRNAARFMSMRAAAAR